MPGILYVVATPIGNLEDVTFRALRVLREVSLIAAEDTRRTARLLQHYSISTPTTSLHEHNERVRVAGLIERLARGDSIALVTDAGTPTVSDPGTLLVAAAHASGIRVEPIPGASAALAALSASGLSASQVVFAGFPPSRSHARKKWLSELAGESRLLVIFEAPHRISATLTDMREILGDRIVAVGRELTKAHEELVVRPISQHLARLGEGRGEFTLVVAPEPPTVPAGRAVEPADLTLEFGQLTADEGMGRREALRLLARKYGLSARDTYRRLEDNKAK